MTEPLTVSQQAHILKWALDRGLLTQEEIALSSHPDAHTLSEADLAARFQALLEAGRLQGIIESALDADREDTALASHNSEWLRAMGEASATLGAEDLAGFTLSRDGRYLPLAFLGDGGMGAVYKAFDQQLKRVVALKFLKHLERGSGERFMQEGRAQARIEHPNICNIYSVDEQEGHPYLSMRFIAGPTLRAAIPRLTLEQKVRIVAQVAQALHSCHRQGIVHRDIKPTNIMLEEADQGGWWPYLMDFGLAGETGELGLGIPGLLIGTPVYCSPEQVQGHMELVDRRSDVYALGATLYECLCGKPPFSSGRALGSLISRITEDGPRPLRQRVPGLPRDLETIVAKAMERDPEQRYPSARAMAEDLQRFLDGDPILAHPGRFAYRLFKRVRKHRVQALVLTLSGLAVLGFAGFGAAMAWRGRAMSMSIREYGREAEFMENLLLKAYALPLHDVSGERAMVQQRLERIAASLGQLGRWSRPAAHLALGLALTRLYQSELEGLRGKALEDKKKDCERDLRQPALACLRRAQGAHQDGPAYVEGVLALVEERYPDAIAKARAYQAQAPWSADAWLLEAAALRAQAGGSLGQGDFASTEGLLEQAGRALAQARNVARSSPQAYLGEVQRLQVLFSMRLDRGRATLADRDAALAAVDLCLTANPGDWKALSYRAAVHRRWGAYLLNRHQDPSASLDLAVAAAEAGLRFRPDDNPLWNNLGTCLRNRGEWEYLCGRDPGPDLARALAALAKALDRPQFKDWLLDSMGCCHSLLARYQLEHGQDPGEAVRQALDCLGRAAALKPWVGHETNQGDALRDLALYQFLQGRDPAASFRQALAAYDRALQLNAHSYQAQLGVALVLLDRAETAPTAELRSDLARAAGHLDTALALNPGLVPEALPARARCRALQALDAPAGAAGAIAAARADLARAAAQAGARPDVALAMAEAWQLVQRAAPSSDAAARGLACLAPVLAERSGNAAAALAQGRLLTALGRLPEARKAFARAAELNSNLRRLIPAG